MKNVYDEVQTFYEEEIILEPVIKREWVDGYLRQKAWQGTTLNNLFDSCLQLISSTNFHCLTLLNCIDC